MSEPIEQTREIDTLAPHPRNYNQHPAAQIERIAASLQQFGQVRPVVVHRNTIIAGHGVHLAAQQLGYRTLRVTQLPDAWTDEQALAYLVADNETRRGAEPDAPELAALLDELRQVEFNLSGLGFNEQEYAALLAGLTPTELQIAESPDEDDEQPPAPEDFWLSLQVLVSPDTLRRWSALMERISGDTDDDRVTTILDIAEAQL